MINNFPLGFYLRTQMHNIIFCPAFLISDAPTQLTFNDKSVNFLFLKNHQ